MSERFSGSNLLWQTAPELIIWPELLVVAVVGICVVLTDLGHIRKGWWCQITKPTTPDSLAYIKQEVTTADRP